MPAHCARHRHLFLSFRRQREWDPGRGRTLNWRAHLSGSACHTGSRWGAGGPVFVPGRRETAPPPRESGDHAFLLCGLFLHSVCSQLHQFSSWVPPSHFCGRLSSPPPPVPWGCVLRLLSSPEPLPGAAHHLGVAWSEEGRQISCFPYVVHLCESPVGLFFFFCLVIRRNFFILENMLVSKDTSQCWFSFFPFILGK